jgi:hypothetical protein
VIADRATRQAAARIAGRVRAAGASRSGGGRFTSVDAGRNAGEVPASPPTPSPVSRFPSPASPSDPGCNSCGGPTTRQYLDGRWLWLCPTCPMEGVA